MNPIENPFAPGAGTPPPELAGRDPILNAATLALQRVLRGRPERSQMLLGLRGVGKTVLLNEVRRHAEAYGYQTAMVEAPEGERLASLLVPKLQGVLVRLSAKAQARAYALQALRVLRGFASVFKVSMGELEFGLDAPPVEGVAYALANSGNLEVDLPELLLATGQAAQHAGSGVLLLVDEVQYLTKKDLSALIVALHTVSQRNLPLLLFGAGLPQVAALAGAAKSYAERLFVYPGVGALPPQDAHRAIAEPLRDQHVTIESGALDLVYSHTKGYPYFLQEWGKHVWLEAEGPHVTVEDVRRATPSTIQALDTSFFRVRYDRLTPREQEYLRAMAALGAGPHRSGDIASELGIDVTAAGPLRNGLIKKGMVFSPAHGSTAFTVPLFDQFMKRRIPVWPVGQ